MIFLLASCANIVPPSGGPKDVAPPKVIRSNPENYAINFKEDNIRIYFNEFIRLKNIASQVIISPPIDKMPDFKVRSKSIIIEFKEPFKDSTTYTIYFGDAIVDITEENPATNYQFVFATGSIIDTLSVKGRILNAFNLTPEKGIYVMLYENHEDSVPMNEKPYYLSKTNATGKFELNNLKKDDYKIFALKDNNSNYMYDLPNEQIAFLDSLIEPKAFKKDPKLDTIIKDTLVTDTVNINNVIKAGEYQLLLFEEIDSIQRLNKTTLLRTGLVEIIFKYPTRNLELIPIYETLDDQWYLMEYSNNKDTLNLWSTNKDRDTITLQIKENDSILDTINIKFIVKSRGRRSISGFGKNPKLVLTPKSFGKHNLNKPVIINCYHPVKDFDFSNIIMIEGKDTLKARSIDFKDELKRNIRITHSWEEKTTYQFIFPDSCLYDLYGFSNDSLKLTINTKEMKDYGTLKVNIQLENPGEQYIIQFLNTEEKILQEKIITESGWIEYEYLLPGKYKLKAIHDQNKNRQWDRGVYLEHKQPESVYYFKTELQIRANWEIEESWILP
ncbi:Ig-like domain-containing protein [Bacteroidota bacterium]